MNETPVASLSAAARQFGTPLYAYDINMVRARLALLHQLFGGRFGVSFAIKSNPNVALLREMGEGLATYDASSFAEVERAMAAGASPSIITFSGPAKRRGELERAIALGVGELVLESMDEALMASDIAAERNCVQQVLLRINPMRAPRHFGASMAGRPSQFGFDEEAMDDAIRTVEGLDNLKIIGFHIYSGTNSLSAEAISENFGIFIDIFRRAAATLGRSPQKLIFGSGFGIPYLPDETPLDVEALATLVSPQIDALRSDPLFADTNCTLEMGRWLIGPAGWLLTSVVSQKTSRGVAFRMCDAGFNNHLAACGMMGSVIRRNWIFTNVSNPAGAPQKYNLVGPLCTTIDIIASNLELPEVRVGDVIAISQSGAYGLTASPTRFISHPEPREVLMSGSSMRDVTESSLNHWTTPEA